VNRESAPLILAVLIPVIIVVFIFLNYGDTSLIRYIADYIPSINPLYYIVLVPFILGLTAAVLVYRKIV